MIVQSDGGLVDAPKKKPQLCAAFAIGGRLCVAQSWATNPRTRWTIRFALRSRLVGTVCLDLNAWAQRSLNRMVPKKSDGGHSSTGKRPSP